MWEIRVQVIFYTLFAAGVLVFVNTFLEYPSDSPLPSILPYTIIPYSNCILMGQFNYVSLNVSTWIDSWSKHFNPKDIVIATPNDTLHPYPNLTSAKYMFYQSDQGYYSPYINIGKLLRANPNLRALLYVHDDLLITSSLWKNIGTTTWMVGTQFWEGYEVIKLYKNGTISTNNTMFQSWPWWKGCHEAFNRMLDDKEISPYLHESKTEGAFINVRFGQSDMLYTYFYNIAQKDYFLRLLNLFSKYELFLECAVPTAVLMMQEKFGITVYNAPLCTSWQYGTVRKNPDRLIQTCTEEGRDYQAYHPIKLSTTSNWSMYFDKIMNL